LIEFNDVQTTVAVILAALALIGAVWNTYKIAREAHQPTEDRVRRLEVLEEHDANDNKRLEELERESRLVLKAQMVIIEHLMTSNGTPQLQEVKDEIQAYLINR
jgi:hypothetical protein